MINRIIFSFSFIFSAIKKEGRRLRERELEVWDYGNVEDDDKDDCTMCGKNSGASRENSFNWTARDFHWITFRLVSRKTGKTLTPSPQETRSLISFSK